MNRSEIRHALYRAKNGIFAEDKQFIYDMVEPKLPVNENWNTFTINWDIFYKDGEITVVKPETDYDFIHTTCLEKALHIKNNIHMEATNRQLNTIQIVELSMLDGKMTWQNYNKTWGVSVDRELKRINTKLFLTDINEVTEEMIKNSTLSDGSAMNELPSIPEAVMSEPEVMSDDEIARFKKTVNIQSKRKSK